jgi:hypothetical protein
MVYPKEDRTRYEFQTHLARMGIGGTIIEPGMLDLDHDYPYLDLDGPVSGATSLGSIRLHGHAINIINIIREKIFEVGHLGFGGDYGPIEFAGSGWRLRFFVTVFDEWEVPLPPDLTEFNITTDVKIEKRFLNARVADFGWQTRKDGEMTRIESEILRRINDDTTLRSWLLNELIRERNITIQSYRPKKTPQQAGAEQSDARIVIYGEPKKRKDTFISKQCLDMYNKIAEHILQAKAVM